QPASGTAVNVTATSASVKIDGFQIQGDAGITASVSGNNNDLQLLNNKISGTNAAITSAFGYGVYALNGHSVVFTGNSIGTNLGGVAVNHSSGSIVTITGNS